MDYETALKTCSEEVQAAINWLEEKVRFNKRKLENRLKEFLDAAKREEFWLDKEGPEGFDEALFYDPYLLWYLSKTGLRSNEYFKEALEACIKNIWNESKDGTQSTEVKRS